MSFSQRLIFLVWEISGLLHCQSQPQSPCCSFAASLEPPQQQLSCPLLAHQKCLLLLAAESQVSASSFGSRNSLSVGVVPKVRNQLRDITLESVRLWDHLVRSTGMRILSPVQLATVCTTSFSIAPVANFSHTPTAVHENAFHDTPCRDPCSYHVLPSTNYGPS